ncbi:MAG: enoyl-CoA hydratase-related protein [Aquisalimonadaceae bacterium]
MSDTTTVQPTVLVEDRGNGTAVMTLNRPEAMNSINNAMAGEFVRLFSDWAVRTDIRCVVLAASGTRAFCAGADLKERNGLDFDGVRRQHALFRLSLTIRQSLEMPVIAAVQGLALGGGAELAMASDIVYAAPEAEFGLPEIRVGIMPGMGGTQFLPRIVGRGKAMDMLLSGDRISADAARACGIVADLFPRDELVDRAVARAEQIAAMPPLAVRAVKRAVTVGGELDLNNGLAYELALHQRLMASTDREEGIRAFVEKRAAKWVGE